MTTSHDGPVVAVVGCQSTIVRLAYINPTKLMSYQRAVARLKAYVAPPTVWSSLPLSRRAAVLILLFADRHGDLKVILTLRANTLNSCNRTLPIEVSYNDLSLTEAVDAGQVSFPGGMYRISLKAGSLSLRHREGREFK